MKIENHPAFHFVRFFAQRFNDERCLQVAGSLTFTTLLSLVPLVAIALTLISAFPVFSQMTIHIKAFLFSNLVPESSGKILTLYVTQFSQNAEKLTAFGIAFLTLTALTLMLTIDHIFNTIWRISRKRTMLHRVLIYWAVLTVGPVLIGGSLSITSWLLGHSVQFIHPPHEFGFVLLKIVPAILTIAALSLMYLIVPNTAVPKWHALLGGVLAGSAFELMKIWFGWYVTHFTTYTLVYGAFASIPVFLLWIYLSWLIVLSGALFTASLPFWEQSAWSRKSFPGKRFYDALLVLEALYGVQKSGGTLEADVLHRRIKVDFDIVESILDDFSAHGLAKEAVEGGWLLARDAADIMLSDVYRMTVFDPDQGRTLPDALDRKISDAFENAMKIPLKTAFGKN